MFADANHQKALLAFFLDLKYIGRYRKAFQTSER